MNALAVLHDLIDSHDLHDATLTLVSHAAGDGWRERVSPPAPPSAGVQVSGGVLRRLSAGQLGRYRNAAGEVVSLSSSLAVRGERRHLALMDLQVNDELVPLPFLRDIVEGHCGGRPARFLWSGRGYHVYGDFLLDESEWLRWNNSYLERYALAHPLYIVQSLAWRCNLLRLTAGRDRQVSEPATVEEEPPGQMVAGARRLAHVAHLYQTDGAELVVRHLAEVAVIARGIYTDCPSLPASVRLGATADEVYACGYLHACLENTATDYEDVLATAGERVAGWVAELSRDKRVPGVDGRSSYEQQLGAASLPARIVKLADLLSELRGLARGNGDRWTAGRLGSVDRQLFTIRQGLEGCGAFEEAARLVNGWRGLLPGQS